MFTLKQRVENHLQNKTPLSLLIELYTTSGKLAATGKQNIDASTDSVINIKQNIIVQNHRLWSIDKPQLYKAKTKLMQDSEVIDEDSCVILRNSCYTF